MVTKTHFQWHIPRRHAHCAWSQEIIPPGNEVYSLLIEEEEQFVREDYSSEGWEQAGRERCAQVQGIHWKGRVPEKKEKPQLPQDRDERALHLLKERVTQVDPFAQEEAFFLALYLLRRRRLALRQEIVQGGVPLSLYEVMDTEEMVTVPRLVLSEIETAQVQARLADSMAAK